MTTQPSAMPESPLESRAASPATQSPTRPFYWCVRRELWEYRSIYRAPLAVAGVYLFAYLFVLMGLPSTMRHAMTLAPSEQRNAIIQPYDMALAVVMGAAFIVAIIYCLDALYGERRDRSILFWKSLPVSDLTIVLAKASIPFLVVPMVAFIICVITQVIMFLLSSLVLLANGLSPVALWQMLSPIHTWFFLLYHLFTVHVLWYAPTYAWMLFVSAWARRAPLLWAILPPLAFGIFERVVFGSSHFAHLVGYRFSGGTEIDQSTMKGEGFPFHPGIHLTPGHFLSTPGLWIGLLISAVFLAAAVRLRRNREPI